MAENEITVSDTNELSGEKKPFDTDAFKARQKAARDAAYSLADTQLDKLRRNPSALTAYLNTQAQLPGYSVTNVLLLSAQLPVTPTRLKSFAEWKEQNVSVKKGQRAVTIIKGTEFTRHDGTAGLSYSARQVFDVSQTTEPAARHALPDTHDAIASVIEALPYEVKVLTEASGENGAKTRYDARSNTLFCARTRDASGFYNDLLREIAHAELTTSVKDYDRTEQSFAADCAAYMLCRTYGVEPFAVPAVPERLGGKELKAELSRAAQTVRTLKDRVYDNARQNERVPQKGGKSNEKG